MRRSAFQGSRRPLLIVDCPTPQRAPTFNALATSVDFLVVYIAPGDTSRGWGSVQLDHPHVVLRRGPVRSVAQVLRLACGGRTSAVCSFGYWRPANVAAIIAARVTQKELVLRSDSNAWRDEQRSRLLRVGKRVLLRSLLGAQLTVWAVGARNAAYWRALGYENQVKIPYTAPMVPVGSDGDARALRRSLNIRDDQFVILYVGRLFVMKGIRDLCDAFRAMAPVVHGAVLVIVGDGPERRRVEQLAADGVPMIVVGAVTQSKLGPFYAMSDLVVVPSHVEGWGLVVNEALANGRRVAASSAVGAADDLLTADNGARFPPRDPAGLRQVLEDEVRKGRSEVPPLIQPDVVRLFEQELQRLST